MIITIDASSPPSLDDIDNFRAFKVVCTSPKEACRDQFSLVGRLDGDHAWIDPDWLKRNGIADPEWTSGLAKMLDYAASSGWTDEHGAIRAHIEQQ